ncbi:MAG: HYR domain-containing protein, partial [Acidobacteria bacterium]|nr:HYR domain-containing protein [Acidobacteriota bacterium]
DEAGHSVETILIADGDGIAASIDRNKVTGADESTVYSSEYRKDAQTYGHIVIRHEALTIEDVASGPWVYASGSGDIAACGGAFKQIQFAPGAEAARWYCDEANTLFVTALQTDPAHPWVEVWKSLSGGWALALQLAANQTASTGSPATADPSNLGPVPVTIFDDSGTAVGGFVLDPGESVNADTSVGDDGRKRALVTVLNGTVTVTLSGISHTLTPADGQATFIHDTEPPVIGPVSDITAEATSADGAVVSFALPTVTDFVDPAPVLTASPASGSQFPLGETVVTLTATDAAGLSATASFTVTVVDTTPPELTLPEDQVLEATTAAGAEFSFTPAVTDLVDANPEIVCTPGTTYTYPLGPDTSPGTTTVSCTATDNTGNARTETFTVTVHDTTAPVIHPHAPATTTPPDAPISYTATAADAVSTPVTTITGYTCTMVNGSGRVVDKRESCGVEISGSTIRILDTGGVGDRIGWSVTATDAAGNTATDTYYVDVVNPATDTTAPPAPAPPRRGR